MREYKLKYLNSNTYREARFYAKKIMFHTKRMTTIDSNEKLDDINRALNKKLNQSNESHCQLSILRKNWTSEFNNEHQLNNESFNWFKKDMVSSLFVLSIINSEDTLDKIIQNHLSHIIKDKKVVANYKKTRQSLNEKYDKLTIISSQKDINRSLINCFHNCEENIENQREFMKLLQSIYSYSILLEQNKRLREWLNKNDQIQILWVLEYLNDKIELGYVSVWNTTNTNDHYLSIIWFFCINFLVNPDGSELIIRKMKSAWSQKKFRDKNSDYKPYSISMNKETKKQLTWLVKQEEKNIQQVIQKIINDAYTRKKNKIYD
ncbi:hypothetical protein [Vibrio parahaemolyticus]|uniref:hypothetical protein n=2 Tax=Vibrio harveyi group TaxID=717610 RepID=UPI0023627FFA|nr:hypothetical protein [Vibrio parahaemolyticus]